MKKSLLREIKSTVFSRKWVISILLGCLFVVGVAWIWIVKIIEGGRFAKAITQGDVISAGIRSYKEIHGEWPETLEIMASGIGSERNLITPVDSATIEYRIPETNGMWMLRIVFMDKLIEIDSDGQRRVVVRK